MSFLSMKTRSRSFQPTKNFFQKEKADAGDIYIPVVFSGDKTVEAQPGMKRRVVNTGEMCETFPYHARSILAFKKIDGVDVCFFAMQVQEYGSDAPMPNTLRVYFAYLDSVHFFWPKHLRTAVYYQIILGYLDNVRKIGYTKAHIWSSPPLDKKDYIFYRHTPDKKFPIQSV